MKLKRLPDDFQVDEITSFMPSQGAFALYRLTKRNLGTPEAIDAILRRWRIPRSRVSSGGLKDRHAQTSQRITIEQGPRRGLKQTNLELVYLGQVDRPFTSTDIQANRFHIVVRDLSDNDVRRLRTGLESARREGVPNYFDAQRFGSRGQSREFIAAAWARGDYERAIWLAIADTYPHDRPQQRKQRQYLRDHWGDWAACLAVAQQTKPIIAHLAAHPDDFYGAMPLVRADMRWLYLSAFQSFLWNRLLTAWITRQCRSEQILHTTLDGDRAAFYRALDSDQQAVFAAARLPLPSGRFQEADEPWLPLVDEVLAEVGLTRKHLKLDYPRGSFFSRGDRAAIFVPQNLAGDVADDELYPGSRRLMLDFELPRGCYATTLIRRIEMG